MSYKVFLVEDEIVTREGIRDNVDWRSAGFEFCGEASDGEVALPLIEASKPDVLITDIKMPFMDGLQLSRIIREHMPWIKIIILSGHDEFDYAKAAIKIGVAEYLLKPVASEDLIEVLQKVALSLDQESKERESLKHLQEQAKGSIIMLREKFLLRLVMGGVSSAEAIEQGQRLGLNIVSKYYLVLLVKIELCDSQNQLDYQEYQRVEQLVSTLAGNNPNILYTKKELEELVLILKGDDLDQLHQEGSFLVNLIQQEGQSKAICNLIVEMGQPQQRIGDIHRSFTEALVKAKNVAEYSRIKKSIGSFDQIEMLKMEHSALEDYLRFGRLQHIDDFIAAYLQPINDAALNIELVKNYRLVDIVLTVSQFVSDLGGKVEQVSPDINDHIERLLQDAPGVDQMNRELKNLIAGALSFRDGQTNHERSILIQEAKSFIKNNFSDPDLHMIRVAAKFNLSPSHFSTVFSQEIGATFRDYLNTLRIDRAKELLRTTNLKCSEIAYQCGYNDSHYFSTVFKKKTGFSPQQFRGKSHRQKELR
jgi:two-component system, response regulator YesN